MATTQQECVTDISEWSEKLKRSAENAPPLSETAWADNPQKDYRLSTRRPNTSAKGDVTQWAEIVRRQYETNKRAIRVMRWTARHRHTQHESETPEQLFHREAEKWKVETMHSSSVAKIISHSSYLRIIGLAREFKRGEIESLILQEIESEPDHWFAALEAITGQNPVRPDDDFDAAVEAWLDWGRREGIIANDNAKRAER